MNCSNGKPIPKPLSPKDKDSFAFPTMKDRVPVIICKVIDLLYRDRASLNLTQPDDLKNVIEGMSKLRYEIVTNKKLSPITDGSSDAEVWNEFLTRLKEENENQDPTWFGSRWLSVECFVYRRLLESMKQSSELATYDFFAKQKREAFYGSLSAISNLLKSRDTWQENDQSKLLGLLKISLWGNKCDLSISAGSSQNFHHDPLHQITEYESNLLIDDAEKVVDFLYNGKKDCIIDIIMDNAGFELVSDLVLADYLVSSDLVQKVRLRVKNQPWFVSDTMVSDIDYVINEMVVGGINCIGGSTEQDPILCKFGIKWKKYLSSNIWSVHPDAFWTYPHDFSLMRKDDPTLYSQLSESNLLIFKGDLNYRKLVGDLAWSPTDTFVESLQDFNPAPLVSLRTLKADVVVGLREDQVETTKAMDESWMVNGNWGVIQFCTKVVTL